MLYKVHTDTRTF